jgi:acyl-CoA synthetase (AMP-forming)/AMP-acid ligase II/acyl carrier protein
MMNGRSGGVSGDVVGFVAASAHLEPEEIAAALLRSSAVAECAVLARSGPSGESELVAYVAGAGMVTPERLRAHLAEALPGRAAPAAFVQVSSLPLTPEGAVDEGALRRLPVVDAALSAAWEERVAAIPSVDRAAVLVEEAVDRSPPLHVMALVPGFSAAPDDDSGASVSAGAEPVPDPEPAVRPPAYSDGGPLTVPDSEPKTLIAALHRAATKFGHKGITYIARDGAVSFQSYAALLEGARRILAGLTASGLGKGDRVVLQIDSLELHFTAFWGCVLAGVTPVTVAVAPSYEVESGVTAKVYNIWELLKHPPLIASRHLVGPISNLERLHPMKGLRMLVAEDLFAHAPAEIKNEARPEDLVFFQLSSGSTGVPKCIQETHRGIILHVHGEQQFCGYTSDEVDLNWLPVDHVVPILTCHLRDTYLGCSQVHVKADAILSDPLLWLDLLHRYKATLTWAPNFGFKLVADNMPSAGDRTWDLSSMKFFMNAGEQVTLPVVRDFLRMLAPFGVREDAMQPAFGMAEVCTCMTYQNHFSIPGGVHQVIKSTIGGTLKMSRDTGPATAAFVDLGPPVPGVEIRITDADNRVVTEDVIGRLQIRGGVVTPGYVDNPTANQEAFVGEGWFNTGDLGFMHHGALTLTGREKEMIIVRGANFYCYEIEDVVNTLPGVEPTFSAACAVADPSTGSEGLAIFFVPREGTGVDSMDLVGSIKAHVASTLGISPAYVVPMARREFGKTTSGKIQRMQMKKALAAGKYDERIRAIDVHEENANTLPDWFYQRIWRRKSALARAADLPAGRWMIFGGEHAGGLAEALRRRGREVVVVEAGAGFESLGEGRYRVDPASREDHARLFEAVSADTIVHLFTYGGAATPVAHVGDLARAQDHGVLSVLALIQGLRDAPHGDHVTLLVGSSHTQPATPGDAIAVERTPIVGLTRTLGHELGWMRARHVDLPPGDDAIDRLLFESTVLEDEPEVAYRDGERWVPRLRKAPPAEGELSVKKGGLYVLAGDLAGTGATIARWLLDRWGVRLVLLGHAAVALDDAAAIREAIARAESKLGASIDGIVLFPEDVPERLLSEETRAGVEAALRATAYRAFALQAALHGRAGRPLFACFSSAGGLFGGATMGAMNAAASFLDALPHHLRASSIDAYCIGWTLWDRGAGGAHPAAQAAAARGYMAIPARQALVSLLAVIRGGAPHVAIGLDGDNRHIQGAVDGAARPATRLRVHFTANARHEAEAAVRALKLADRFGEPSAVEISVRSEMPVLDDGSIDRETLASGARAAEPSTALEREIAAIWREVLGASRIGVHDSFFALGGHSLLATQIVSRLRGALGVDVSLQELFEGPTIAEIAKAIERRQIDEAGEDQLAELLAELDGLSETEARASLANRAAPAGSR